MTISACLQNKIRTSDSNVTRRVLHSLGTFGLILVFWSFAWLFKSCLDRSSVWSRTELATAIFWLIAKIAVWIMPACVLIWCSGRDLRLQFNLKDWRRWCCWGTTIGLLIASTAFIPKAMAGSQLIATKFDHGTINVLIVAPLFEEFLCRAAIMGHLIPAIGFARANVVASICFLMLHVPGWYMQGLLAEMLCKPIGGALSIFVLGLCFGWITKRGRSFLGGPESLATGLRTPCFRSFTFCSFCLF